LFHERRDVEASYDYVGLEILDRLEQIAPVPDCCYNFELQLQYFLSVAAGRELRDVGIVIRLSHRETAA
jgi:hypothetical protein